MIKKNVIANLFKNWKKMIEMCFSEDIQISICVPLTPPKDTYNQMSTTCFCTSWSR